MNEQTKRETLIELQPFFFFSFALFSLSFSSLFLSITFSFVDRLVYFISVKSCKEEALNI